MKDIVADFKRCLSSDYFKFSGRARRREYWMFTVFANAIMYVFQFFILLFQNIEWVSLMFTLGALIFALFMIIPSISVAVRRLHDVGRSGWWLVSPVAPLTLLPVLKDESSSLFLVVGLSVIASMVMFIFMLIDGNKEPNIFGQSPKAVTAEGVSLISSEQGGEESSGSDSNMKNTGKI